MGQPLTNLVILGLILGAFLIVLLIHLRTTTDKPPHDRDCRYPFGCPHPNYCKSHGCVDPYPRKAKS